jgi:hypothetical protein
MASYSRIRVLQHEYKETITNFDSQFGVSVRSVYRRCYCGNVGGFGGLVVSMLASGTQVRGFKPGQKPSDFSGQKIHSMPSFGREVKPSVPCRRFVACKKHPAIYVEVGIAGQIDRPFLAQFRRTCRLTWSASGDDGRN